MKLKKQDQGLVKTDLPHYYEVKIKGHPNGVPQIHCGREKDAIDMCERYPGSQYTKIYLPHAPETVDVSYVTMENDKQLPTIKIGGQELPIQQQLPQNCQEPFIPTFHD